MEFLYAVIASISLISSEIKTDQEMVHKMGKEEVLSLPFTQIADFLWNRYVLGPFETFQYYGANPQVLTREAAQRPATILIHASESNQGQWINLLEAYGKKGDLGPVFTFNYEDGEEFDLLLKKIASVKALYKEQGVNEITINLVGHSLGGIVAAEYAFSPEAWIEGVHVGKVITIASRLKNDLVIKNIPYYNYAREAVQRAEILEKKIMQGRVQIELYTIAAENDWLVPKASVFVIPDSSHNITIPEVGHVTIAQSPITISAIINLLEEQSLVRLRSELNRSLF